MNVWVPRAARLPLHAFAARLSGSPLTSTWRVVLHKFALLPVVGNGLLRSSPCLLAAASLRTPSPQRKKSLSSLRREKLSSSSAKKRKHSVLKRAKQQKNRALTRLVARRQQRAKPRSLRVIKKGHSTAARRSPSRRTVAAGGSKRKNTSKFVVRLSHHPKARHRLVRCILAKRQFPNASLPSVPAAVEQWLIDRGDLIPAIEVNSNGSSPLSSSTSSDGDDHDVTEEVVVVDRQGLQEQDARIAMRLLMAQHHRTSRRPVHEELALRRRKLDELRKPLIEREEVKRTNVMTTDLLDAAASPTYGSDKERLLRPYSVEGDIRVQPDERQQALFSTHCSAPHSSYASALQSALHDNDDDVSELFHMMPPLDGGDALPPIRSVDGSGVYRNDTAEMSSWYGQHGVTLHAPRPNAYGDVPQINGREGKPASDPET